MKRHELVALLSDTWPNNLCGLTDGELEFDRAHLALALDGYCGDALAEIDCADLLGRAAIANDMLALAAVGALVTDTLTAYAVKLVKRDVAALRDFQQSVRELESPRRETREGYFGVASQFGGAR